VKLLSVSSQTQKILPLAEHTYISRRDYISTLSPKYLIYGNTKEKNWETTLSAI
jgi:hypothetical protein